jgi:multidrug resistance efflux pump
MVSSLPKFRNDLIIRQQETASGRFFIVKDPVSGQFFRFREVERFIAEQCDGETPLPVLQQRAEETFGASLSAETLSAFIRNLEKTGLLETEEPKKKGDQQGRIRGSPLYLRFKLFDPARLFDRLMRRTGFFFTPYFGVLSAAFILLAVGILMFNWSVFTQDLSRLYQLASIPLFVAVIFLVVSLHEFAHGLTCRHFGGEVHDIGFMLIYFQPALYCNVSDAWLFPEKSKRLWVGFAGPYFELFCWALATLTWRLTEVDAWINYLALIVMTGSGIKTFLNFNPFIKLDGYYLLSDYLEIPNLRKKSFRYVGGWIERVFGVASQTTEPVSRRERTIYFAYGLTAMSGSVCLLGYVFTTAGGYLVEGHQAMAALLMGLLGVRWRRRFRKLFGKPSALSDPEEGGAVLTTAETAESSEPAAPRKKRSRSLWKRQLAWIALAAAALAALYFGRMELRIGGPFNVLPVHNADIRAEIDGIIEEIYVTEGDAVQEGDLLARLSGREHRSELQKTEAEIRQARARLRILEIGPTRAEIELAQTAIERARDRLKYAHARLDRNKGALDRNLISRKEFEDTQELAVTAEKDVAEAEDKLQVLLKRVRPEEIEAGRADVTRLEAQKRYLEGQLQRVEVRSPVAGIVATPARQLKEMVHQAVQKGALVARVYDFKTLTVEIAIPEKEIADINVGQQVDLKARSFPDETFHGTVTSIATTAGSAAASTVQAAPPASGGVEKTILITTEIDNRSFLLKPGMTGHAKVSCGQRRLFDLMTRHLVRTVKVEFWSWWWW